MSLVSILEKPSTPYRYVFISGVIVYGLVPVFRDFLTLFLGYTPDPISFLTVLSFVVAMVAVLLVVWQPFEWVLDYLVGYRDTKAPCHDSQPLRNKVSQCRLLERNRENLLNSFSLFLGNAILPGIVYVSTPAAWALPLLWIPLLAPTLVFLYFTIRRATKFWERVNLARYLYVASDSRRAYFEVNVKQNFERAAAQLDWSLIEALETSILQTVYRWMQTGDRLENISFLSSQLAFEAYNGTSFKLTERIGYGGTIVASVLPEPSIKLVERHVVQPDEARRKELNELYEQLFKELHGKLVRYWKHISRRTRPSGWDKLPELPSRL